ncbi:MAG: hypothetical protein AAGC88_12950 [Bacteroidota bacterium]
MNILAGIILLLLGVYTLVGSYLNRKERLYPLITEWGIVLVVFGIYAFFR